MALRNRSSWNQTCEADHPCRQQSLPMVLEIHGHWCNLEKAVEIASRAQVLRETRLCQQAARGRTGREWRIWGQRTYPQPDWQSILSRVQRVLSEA